MDRVYRYYKAKNNGVGKPEYRLGVLLLPLMDIAPRIDSRCSIYFARNVPLACRIVDHRLVRSGARVLAGSGHCESSVVSFGGLTADIVLLRALLWSESVRLPCSRGFKHM